MVSFIFYSFSYRRNRRFSKILFIEQTKGLNRCIVSGLRRCLLPRFGKRRERFGAIGSASDIRTELGVQIKFRMWKSCFFLFYKTINVILLHKKMHIFFKSPFFISPIEQSKNTLECFNIQFCIASGFKNYLRRFLQFERLLKSLTSTKSKISD